MIEREVKSRMSGSARPSVVPEAPKAGAARQRYLGLGNLGDSGPLLGRDGCDGPAGAMRLREYDLQTGQRGLKGHDYNLCALS
jgi:hypothetical protein